MLQLLVKTKEGRQDIGIVHFITHDKKQNKKIKMYQSSKTPPHRPGPRIELVNGVSRFKTSFNPVITKQDKQILEAKLAIEKQSTAATSQRVFNNKLYINYTRNPFNNVSGQKHRFSNSLGFISVDNKKLEKPVRGKKLSMAPQQTSLIDELTSLQTGTVRPHMQKKLKRFQKINSIIAESSKTSNKILSQIQKTKATRSITEETPTQKKPQIKKQIIGLKDDQKAKIHKMSLEQIVGMQDTNYFFNEGRKRMNIFKSLRQDEENPSSFEQLSKFKFNFDSMIAKTTKLSKISIPTLRQLSRIGRQAIYSKINVRKIIDLLENEQINMKQKQLKFIDLMGLASGRLSVQLLHQLNSGYSRNDENSDTSSQQNDDNIIYKADQNHYGDLFKGSGEDKKQIDEFQHLQLAPRQLIFRQKCKQLKSRVQKILHSKQHALQHQIRDSEVHTSLENKLEQTFLEYVDQKKTAFTDIGKTVRRNKIFKTRDQLFKIENLTNVLKSKNQFDSKLERGERI